MSDGLISLSLGPKINLSREEEKELAKRIARGDREARQKMIEANVRLGFDIVHRKYDQCAEILILLGARRVRLMSNNPEKVRALSDSGIEVVERVPIEVKTELLALKYLNPPKKRRWVICCS